MTTLTHSPAQHSHLSAGNGRLAALLREQQDERRFDGPSRQDHPGESAAPEANDSEARLRQFVIPEGATLEELEQAAVRQTLARCSGNRTHAARRLGISVRTLQRRLKSWGIN